MMTLFAIASETHECYGHGDYGTEERIIRLGAYGLEGFPPVFTTKNRAQEWIDSQKMYSGLVVVKLELQD